MYTASLVVALAGLTAAAQGSDTPSWQTDYSQARKMGVSEGKPLLVVVASGKDGFNKLAKSGTLSKDSSTLLAGKYVCVYADLETEAGKKLAQQLELNGVGIVISDVSGQVMAFFHEGNLDEQNLNTYLTRYADPNRVVSTTDTNPSRTTRTSYYPANTAPVQNYQPTINFGSAGRSC